MAKVAAKSKSSEGWAENIKTLVFAALIAVGIRTVIVEPFNIPSGSMIPTLLVGDYLFVSKFSYGYSRFSLPFSPPLFSGRIFGRVPDRGDVAVFKLPRDNSTDYIKRIVACPTTASRCAAASSTSTAPSCRASRPGPMSPTATAPR